MRTLFKSYYPLPEKEQADLWKTALIVPDANVLLSLYRFTLATRQELIKVLKSLQSRLWIPHQVGAEFHKNRLTVISEQPERYGQFLNKLTGLLQELRSSRAHPFVSPQLLKSLEQLYAKVEDEFKSNVKELEGILDEDPIIESASDLCDGRTGAAFTEKEMEHLRTEGEKRYAQEIPPGYKDKKKPGDDKFGDLIIWKQTMIEAKERKTGVLLLTDDSKDDWWLIHEGKTIGPHPLLRAEFERVTDGCKFYMYASGEFVGQAGSRLKTPVQKDAIKEIKESQTAASALRPWDIPYVRPHHLLGAFTTGLTPEQDAALRAFGYIPSDATLTQQRVHALLAAGRSGLSDDERRMYDAMRLANMLGAQGVRTPKLGSDVPPRGEDQQKVDPPEGTVS